MSESTDSFLRFEEIVDQCNKAYMAVEDARIAYIEAGKLGDVAAKHRCNVEYVTARRACKRCSKEFDALMAETLAQAKHQI